MREINLAVVHCADTPADMDIGAETIRKWHVEDRQWNDIGYHYVIRRDGTLDHGRTEETVGAHAYGFNQNSIGICLVGGKGGFNFTRAQMRTLNALHELLNEKYGKLEWIGHNDVSTKACPQFDVKAYFNEQPGPDS